MRDKLQDVTMRDDGHDGALDRGRQFAAGDRENTLVDINPGAVTKLTDREAFQSVGLVTDIEPFLRELTDCHRRRRIVRQRFRMRDLLLCPPDHYGIEYEINPWMSRARGADTPLVQAQWTGLHEKLSNLDCKVHLVPPQPKLPDMVFTANAGLTVGQTFIPSNFRHEERAGEAPLFAQWMEEHGYEIVWLPDESIISKAKATRSLPATRFFAVTNSAPTSTRIARRGDPRCLVISVELVDPRFYHIDTCFCPLTDGGAVWFPAAFDEYGQRAIRDHVTELIDVAEEEAGALFLQRGRARSRHRPAGRRAQAGRATARPRLQLPPAADDGIPESRRRLQMPDHVHAAAGVVD